MAKRKNSSEAPVESVQDEQAADATPELTTEAEAEAVEARQAPPAVGPKPLVEARRGQAERAEAEPIRSKMGRGFNGRRRLAATHEVVGVDPRQRGGGRRVQVVEVAEPGEVAGTKPATGGGHLRGRRS